MASINDGAVDGHNVQIVEETVHMNSHVNKGGLKSLIGSTEVSHYSPKGIEIVCFSNNEGVGFCGPKSKNRHGGTVLHKHGRVKTKERQAERRKKIGTGEPCHLGTVLPCHMCFGAVRLVAARVCGVVQFSLAARFRL